MTELADRLGYLDHINLGIIRNHGCGGADSPALSMASGISLALNIAAHVIRSGELDRHRPPQTVVMADMQSTSQR